MNEFTEYDTGELRRRIAVEDTQRMSRVDLTVITDMLAISEAAYAEGYEAGYADGAASEAENRRRHPVLEWLAVAVTGLAVTALGAAGLLWLYLGGYGS